MMKRVDASDPDDDQHRYQDVLPGGWILTDRYETPEQTVLRLARSDRPQVAWVTASGPTFEDALTVGVQRIELYEEIDRHWRQRSGPS